MNDTPIDTKRKSGKYFHKSYTWEIHAISNTQPNELENLTYYYQNVRQFLLSRKIQQKFGTFTITSLLRDDDAIAYLAYSFMKADWIHREDGGAAKETLRYNAGRWMIYKYLQRLAQFRKKNILSTDFYDDDENEDFQSSTIINKKTTLDEVLEIEKQNKLEELTKLPCLTSRQCATLQQYYLQHKKLKQIGQYFNLSKQRIEQILQESIIVIKKYIARNPELCDYWQDEYNKQIYTVEDRKQHEWEQEQYRHVKRSTKKRRKNHIVKCRSHEQIQQDIDKQTKVCTECYTEKPFREFHNRGDTKDKKRSCCKVCRKNMVYKKKKDKNGPSKVVKIHGSRAKIAAFSKMFNF